MQHHYQTATIFGGTGFAGRQIVRALAKRGVRIKVATRLPESAYFLKTAGTPGQVVPVPCNYRDAASIARAVAGSDIVVNCIGILYERKGRQSFSHAHVDIPSMIAAACAAEGVQRFIHLSALGVEKSNALYARTKREGEMSVLNLFPHATILRPGVMFGEDDQFFNRFARLAQMLPFLPLIGGGVTRLQPVYVGDVADAVVASLAEAAQGQIFELGGPDIVTFKDIYQTMFRITGQRRRLVTLPFRLAKLQARLFELMPQPMLTRDQVESLKSDNVVSGQYLGFRDLGIHPHGMAAILPGYLSLYRKGGRFETA